MTKKYHFNKKTGRTGICDAKIKCRLGLTAAEHYETREEAQAAFEKTQDGVTSSIKKSSPKEDVEKIIQDAKDEYNATHKSIVSIKGKEARQTLQAYAEKDALYMEGIIESSPESHEEDYKNLKDYFLDGGYPVSFGEDSNFLRHFEDEDSYKVTDELIEKVKNDNLDSEFVDFLSKNKGAELGFLHGVKMSTVDNSFTVDESLFDNEKYRNVRKMPALFAIDRQAHAATQEINEKAAWIFNEESKPTYKRDGTSITVAEDGSVWANFVKIR